MKFRLAADDGDIRVSAVLTFLHLQWQIARIDDARALFQLHAELYYNVGDDLVVFRAGPAHSAHPAIDEFTFEFGLTLDVEIFVESEFRFEFGCHQLPPWRAALQNFVGSLPSLNRWRDVFLQTPRAGSNPLSEQTSSVNVPSLLGI